MESDVTSGTGAKSSARLLGEQMGTVTLETCMAVSLVASP